MKKNFKDLTIGQGFKTEFLFDDCLITGIKKSSRTALMCLDNDSKNDFIMYIGMNTEVVESNFTYLPFIK
tara:strand:+ start:77 stop:286 length:210 start_codon:yes stop_codon:yes gene_type:complete